MKKFVTIEPRIVRLFGKPGDALAATVNIGLEKAYPFKVKKVKTLNREPLEHALEPWEDAGGHGYRIKVNLRKKEAGLFRDALILETDSDIQPEIRINVMAHVEDPAAKAAAAPSGKIKEKQDFNQLIQSLKKQQKTNASAPAETTPKPRNPEEIKKLFQELIKNQQKTE